MDKNSIIGFVLLAAIFIGFSLFQSGQMRKQAELQAQLESVARVEALAREVVRLCEQEKGDFRFSYGLDCGIEDKIRAVVTKVYGGSEVSILPAAQKQIDRLTKLGFDRLPVCIAKTQYSFTDDPTKLGAPGGFTVTVKNVKVSAGAGFVVVLTGDIMTMPGLPRVPAAEKIDVDDTGRISGLF